MSAPDQALRWALQLCDLPTAAGREDKVIEWVRSWCSQRDDLVLTTDEAGNLHVAFRQPATHGRAPVYFTAHLDHPAFVIDRVVAPTAVHASFRGGVLAPYFPGASVAFHTAGGVATGRIAHSVDPAHPAFQTYLIELNEPSRAARPGDVGVWDLPPGEAADGMLRVLACDDLAALAAALGAMDRLRALRAAGEGPGEDVRLLFTRAEEIGFIGAIAACRLGAMPPDARVVALENSRSFDDSPIGGGPIVRVGDRMSVFSSTLTAACAERAEHLAQTVAPSGSWKWQRKLMGGGACEATVFQANGYDATCLCLPLGNYHNMANLTAVQAAKGPTNEAVVDREYVSISDFHGLIDLLVACGRDLPTRAGLHARLDKLWNERSFVLAPS